MFKRLKALLIFIIIAGVLFGQAISTVSKKKAIAVFGVYSYVPKIPDVAIGGIDNAILSIFINMKRFEVQGYGNYRLEAKNVNEFIKRIREIRMAKADIGKESQQFGDVMISADDFDRIANSFIVVVPYITKFRQYYEKPFLIVKKNGKINAYNTEIEVEIRIIDVKNARIIATQKLKGSAHSFSYPESLDGAITDLTKNGRLAVRKIEIFKLKSEIVRVDGSDALFILGSNMGIKPGYEFTVLGENVFGSYEKGFVRVKSVSGNLTRAHILWGDIKAGDRVKEYPMHPTWFSLYYERFPITYTVSNGSEDLSGNIIGVEALYNFGFGTRLIAKLGFIFTEESKLLAGKDLLGNISDSSIMYGATLGAGLRQSIIWRGFINIGIGFDIGFGILRTKTLAEGTDWYYGDYDIYLNTKLFFTELKPLIEMNIRLGKKAMLRGFVAYNLAGKVDEWELTKDYTDSDADSESVDVPFPVDVDMSGISFGLAIEIPYDIFL